MKWENWFKTCLKFGVLFLLPLVSHFYYADVSKAERFYYFFVDAGLFLGDVTKKSNNSSGGFKGYSAGGGLGFSWFGRGDWGISIEGDYRVGESNNTTNSKTFIQQYMMTNQLLKLKVHYHNFFLGFGYGLSQIDITSVTQGSGGTSFQDSLSVLNVNLGLLLSEKKQWRSLVELQKLLGNGEKFTTIDWLLSLKTNFCFKIKQWLFIVCSKMKRICFFFKNLRKLTKIC